MTSEATRNRRELLRILGIGGTAAGLAACSHPHQKHGGATAQGGPVPGGPLGAAPLNTDTTTTSPPSPPVDTVPTIMVIRHAEKPTGHGAAHGVTVAGAADPHALTVAGWARAGALVELFASVRNQPPEGLSRPDAVYAGYGGTTDGLRPLQTVIPLAARLNQEVVTRYSRGHEADLANELIGRTGSTLVCWEHHAISDIVAHLGPANPAPPTAWPDDRFDLVWVFTRDNLAWRFTQVPQLLLAGDRP